MNVEAAVRERAGLIPSMRRLFSITGPRRRLQLATTVLLTLAGAFAELVTIGAVLPLLAIAAAPEKAAAIPVLGTLLPALAATLRVSPMIAAALLLTVAAITATVTRLALSWVSQKFIYGLQRDVVLAVYGRALRQPYDWYLRQNSSVLVSGLDKIYQVVVGIVAPLLLAMSSAVMALFITVFLLVLDPVAALVASASIGAIYLAISLFSRGTLRVVSDGLSESRTARVQIMQETLGGIRDIILDQSQPMFEAKLDRVEERQRALLVVANFLGAAPRLLVEGAAIVLVAVMAAWFSRQPGGVLAAIPVLGALALGAQRLLPMIQTVYLGWSGYSIYNASLGDVMALMSTPVETAVALPPGASARPFQQVIELKDIGFRYNADRIALSAINLSVRKGERIGLIGKTGSGKSTLVDILMGLLSPTSGAVLVDGQPLDESTLANWKAQIAHVPQAIFLADATIAANIAFGYADAEIDHERVADTARKAGMAEFIDSLPQGLATAVGERGIRLSGGQRQRIGIARALYKRASLLILDEATSALDDDTEAAVMGAVDRLDPDLTIVFIAHRLSTVARCQRIYRLDAGRIVQQGSFDQVVGRATQSM